MIETLSFTTKENNGEGTGTAEHYLISIKLRTNKFRLVPFSTNFSLHLKLNSDLLFPATLVIKDFFLTVFQYIAYEKLSTTHAERKIEKMSSWKYDYIVLRYIQVVLPSEREKVHSDL